MKQTRKNKIGIITQFEVVILLEFFFFFVFKHKSDRESYVSGTFFEAIILNYKQITYIWFWCDMYPLDRWLQCHNFNFNKEPTIISSKWLKRLFLHFDPRNRWFVADVDVDVDNICIAILIFINMQHVNLIVSSEWLFLTIRTNGG